MSQFSSWGAGWRLVSALFALVLGALGISTMVEDSVGVAEALPDIPDWAGVVVLIVAAGLVCLTGIDFIRDRLGSTQQKPTTDASVPVPSNRAGTISLRQAVLWIADHSSWAEQRRHLPRENRVLLAIGVLVEGLREDSLSSWGCAFASADYEELSAFYWKSAVIDQLDVLNENGTGGRTESAAFTVDFRSYERIEVRRLDVETIWGPR